MRVLALDTATPFLVAGLLELCDGHEALALERSERVERAHAERAMGFVQDVFQAAKLEPRAELIVVGTGPGSYTGVRVGASLALGLARAWNARVIGVPTLEAIAAAHNGLVAVTLDARKDNVYGAVYHVSGGVPGGLVLKVIVPAEKYALEVFTNFVPDGAVWLRDASPSGLALARLGLQRFEHDKESNLELSYL